jgi:hypothetical protein
MDSNELEIKKFELEQQVKTAELEIKQKELDLKIQEQKTKTIFTPLVITIVGGLLTLITGIVLRYLDNRAVTALEDKKFQSTLLLKAAEAKNFDEFSAILQVFQRNGLLSLDEKKIYDFRRDKFVADQLDNDTNQQQQLQQHQQKQERLPSNEGKFKELEGVAWTIVAGGDTKLASAKFEQEKSKKMGFHDVNIWVRNNSYRTCIGKYTSYVDAVSGLFDAKEKINKSSYIVNLNNWCKKYQYDSLQKVYHCL